MREGFAPFSGLVDIRSATPTSYAVTLGLASLQSQVSVSADDTLVDSGQTATMNRIGSDAIQSRVLALPGRSLPELVSTQPGWLLEANGTAGSCSERKPAPSIPPIGLSGSVLGRTGLKA
jgi:hypothetical protein